MIHTYTYKKVLPSYKALCNKMTLAALSAKDYEALSTASIIDPDSCGLSLCYEQHVSSKTSLILEYSSVIWHNIHLLKKLVDIRTGIKEVRMQSVDETQELIDSTKKLQDFVTVISEQEEAFLSLYDCINLDTFNLYNDFCKNENTMQKLVRDTTEEEITHFQLDLPESLYTPNDIILATSLHQLRDIYDSNHIADFFKGDLYTWATNHIDPHSIDGFFSLQVWEQILSRFVNAQSNALSTDKDKIDAYAIFKHIVKESRHLSIPKPKTYTEANENALMQKLREKTAVNMTFYNELNQSFERLKLLSDNREDPEEEETVEPENNDE